MQTLVDYLIGLGPWNWMLIAVGLLVLETLVPGVHFMWFGVAAVLIGAVALALAFAGVGFALHWQIIAFALVSILTILWARRYWRPGSVASDEPSLNIRGSQYVGRTVTVETAIERGRGKVRVGDTIWSAEGPDLPAGARARVVGANGTVLRIEPAN